MNPSRLSEKRVFVSGAAGVIGRELIPLLHQAGATVFAGDLKPVPHDFPAGLLYRQGDLNTLAKDEIAAFSPEIFIHLAATFERSLETYAFWQENFWHNIRLSHHLMSIQKDLPSLKRVVFASSYLIYDPALYQFAEVPEQCTRLKESDPVYPRNLTGMAKLAHEIELCFLDGFKKEAFTTVCARIFRGYGCRSRDVISRWIRDLLEGREILVYRKEGRFDYIYAADTAAGFLQLAGHTEPTGIVNLGTGKSRQVSDILDILKTHFPGMNYNIVDTDIPFEASEADMSRFSKHIEWLPGHTLESGISRIVAFEKQVRATETSAPSGHILLSSASGKVPMVRAVQEAAAKLNPGIRVFAGDSDPEAVCRYAADGFLQLPATNDTNADGIIQRCLDEHITVVIPSRDGELLFWARNSRKTEAAGIRVMISPESSVSRCIDKLTFYSFGQASGFPVIPTALSPDRLDAKRLVVKERYGAGSRGVAVDVNRVEAESFARTLTNPVFQPFIEGREVSVDAYVDRAGRVKGIILRDRVQIVKGESKITRTFRDATLQHACASYLETLKLQGHVMLQLIIDPTGRHYILECNARFGGASTLALKAGLDSFYWFLLESGGVDITSYPFIRVSGELTQIRVSSDIVQHDSHF